MAEVREMIRKDPILARFVIKASVIPSTKYSWEESPVRFASGSTARDLISLATPGEEFPSIQLRTWANRREPKAASTSNSTIEADATRLFVGRPRRQSGCAGPRD